MLRPGDPAQAALAPGQRPLKVLHLIDNLGMGGAEAWLIELLRHWRDTGAPIASHILATSGGRGVLDDEATALGATIHYLRYGRGHVAAFAAGFRGLLRDQHFDAVHDHQDYASGWHYLLGSGRLPPVRITSVHNPAYQIRNNYGVTPRRRVVGWLGKQLVAQGATHVIGTSREAITAFGFDDPRFRRVARAAVHCGIDPRRFLVCAPARAAVRAEFSWPQDATVVLFAGRFDRSPDYGHPQNHKNSGFAVQVAIDCARREPGTRFLFAGPFSEATPVLQARVDAAGLSERIVFAGVRRDLGRLMSGADVLFFPSRAEGLGMVAVEAQAAGLPVLASAAVPRECVVTPPLVRFLEVTGETPAWCEALLELAAAPRLAPKVANAAVAASPFAIAHSASRLARIYRDGVL